VTKGASDMAFNTVNFGYWYWMFLGPRLKPEKALAAYNRAIQLQPNSYPAWTYKGLMLQALDREDEANACFFKALEINPNYFLAQSSLDLYFRYTCFMKFFEKDLAPDFKEKIEYALTLQEKAIELDFSAENWSTKGALLQHLRRFDEAANSYKRALNLNPNKARNWFEYGRLLEKLGKTKEALYGIEKGLEIEPEDDDAWRKKGELLEKLQRQEEAISAYLKAARLLEKSIPESKRQVPQKNRDHIEVTAYERIGKLLEKAEQYDEAIAFYRKARKFNISPVLHWLYEGDLLNKLQQYENCLELCNQWIAVAPQEYLPWMYQGDAFYKLKRYEEAVVSYNHCIKIDASNSGGWIGRGEALYELQRLEEALESYNQAIALDPTSKTLISQREQVLKELEQRNPSCQET
jgi:tetratricopeptide (TPR) repeat protein